MTTQATKITTPVGRLVGGDPVNPQTTDAEGKPLIIKTGPNAGKPRVDYYLGIAIPKTDPGYADLWTTIYNEARQSFPQLFDTAGNCINPKFAFKVIDGDSQVANGKGIRPCDRQGYPGNWILNFSGGFAPKCYVFENGEHKPLADPSTIKRGHYVQISGSVKGNGSVQQPGIFLNHSMILFVAYGEEIFTGPSPDDAFGSAAPQLPNGASTTPLAPATPMPTTAPVAPVAASMPAAAPVMAPIAPMAAPVATPAPTPMPGTVAPAPEFLNPPAAATYTVNGNQYTAEQLKAAGWDDAQIAAIPPNA